MDALSIPLAVPERRSARPEGAAGSVLFRKLSWLTLFRLTTITVLLGGTILVQFRSARAENSPEPLYGLIAATYGGSLLFALALRARWRLTVLAYAQIGLDVALATAVVSLTGFSESIFVFLFSLTIVNGSVLLFRRGAYVGAGLSLVTYFPAALLGTPRAPMLTLFVHGSAFIATAALAAYLAEQLRSTGERLALREGDLAAITALHEAIVQSVTSGLVTIDPRGRITFVNRAAENMTGLTNETARGERASRWFSAFVPKMTRGEADLDTVRGERLRVGYTIFPLLSNDARPLGSAVIFQDLTALRAMEAQIKRAERLSDLGRVAAGLAHELRNPLASMTGSVELLRANPALRHEDAHLMEIVLREGARLEQLVSHFLTFTRPESTTRIAVDLSILAKETLEVFANDPVASQVTVRSQLEPASAWCDPPQIRQVLWNLLRNAADAVGSRRDGGGSIQVRSGHLDGRAFLEVEDDGPGIAPEEMQDIFAPFFTTKASGTGLGLATVQRIIDAHDGAVTVESPPEGGARFAVSLPRPPATG